MNMALTGVTLALIQPGKGHLEVTGENDNSKPVGYTVRVTAPSWQSSCITRSGKQGVTAFSSNAHLIPRTSLHQSSCKLFFTFSISYCSFFSLEKETTGFTYCTLFGKCFVVYGI